MQQSSRCFKLYQSVITSPHREWSDDIEQWCGATLQELSHAALDRQRWAAIVTMANVPTGVEPTVVDDESVIRPL